MKYYLGIDLGGTKVRVAKVNENGDILQVEVEDSKAKESAEVIKDNIISLIDRFDLSDIEGIGIGVPGPVDSHKKVMTLASNIPALLGYPLADKLEKHFNKKVYINNDANVAGLSEALLGKGKGHEIVYYITHSTGIGGALIIGGKLVNGKNGYAGEIGNIIIDENGEKVNHLNKGSVETEFSGTALSRKATALYKEEVSTPELMRRAKDNDPKALKLIDEMAYDFAKLLHMIAHIISPDCFIIGGGVSKEFDYYIPKVKKYLEGMLLEGIKDIPIYKAELKEPGVVGAALLVKSEND